MDSESKNGSVVLKTLTPLEDSSDNKRNSPTPHADNTSVDIPNGRNLTELPEVKYKQANGNHGNEEEKSRGGCCCFSCCGGKKDTKPKEKVIGVLELFQFASPTDILLMFLGTLGSMTLGVMIPLNLATFGQVINTFVNVNSTSRLVNGTATQEPVLDQMMIHIYFFLGIASTSLVMGFVGMCCFQLAMERQVNTIRIKFFNSVMRQNIGWFDEHEAGEISSHFSEDISKIGEGIGDKLAVFIQWASTWLGAFIMAFTRSWQLALCAMVMTPVIVYLGKVNLRMMRNFTVKEFAAYAKAGAVANQAFRGIRTVQAFQGQEKEAQRYSSNLDYAVKVASKKGVALGLGQAALWFCLFVMFAAIMWLGIFFVQEFDIPAGNVVPVFLGLMVGSMALGNASNNLENFTRARAAAAKIFSMIELESGIDGMSEEGQKPQKIHGNIKVENVHFAYPSRPDSKVLDGLNLEIKQGEHVALVGSSGCGKSTVIQLILRFYDPHAGRVLIDGVDLKEINLKWLRERIGIVSQEPVLFDMSIGENIQFGKLDATQKEIEQAAMDANAHDFIQLLPQGYNTNVGERGAQLSGGQKQRIAIARALIRNPSILLLDEATSALDQESEAVVQNALNKAEEGRTTITIAHRLSTIKHADKIVTVSEGQLVEMGTHNELMDAKGLYYELVQLQAKVEEEGDVDMADVEIVEDDEFEDVSVTDELMKSFKRTLSVQSKNSTKQINLVARSSTRSKKSKKSKIDKELIHEEPVEEVSLKQIMRYNSPEWFLILAGSVGALFGGCFYPAFSFILSEFIKIFSVKDKEEQMAQARTLAGIVFGLAAFLAIIRMVQGYCFCRSGAKLTARLRNLTFQSMINQDIEYFDQPCNQVSSLTTKLSSDAAMVQGASGSKVGQILEALSCLVSAVVIAFVFGWKLAFVVCCFLPLMILAGIIQGYVIKGSAKSENGQLQQAGKICSEVLDNIRTVVSLGREEHFFARFESLIRSNRKTNIKTSVVFGICYGIANCLLYFAYAVAFYYGSILVDDGEMEFFEVFRVFSSIIFGGMMVGRQSSYGVDFTKAKLAASRVIALINRKPKVDVRDTSGSKLEQFSGGLSIENAVFHYPMRRSVPVLQGMNLTFEPGETVALVGTSGCGKSTCTQILQRFYDLDSGSVVVDSVDIKQLNLSWYRKQIGIVSQEPTLFDCSIAENIAYGDNDRMVAMDEIISAAKSANIHHFISSLPQGYDTNAGSKGGQLSGGQKQRIAIARALVRNPKVLLLDEATSALDAESEKTVQDALDKAGVNRTCVTIAHRLSTIQNADKIVVVRKGKVLEQGTHAKLMSRKGAYYRLYSAQNRIVGI